MLTAHARYLLIAFFGCSVAACSSDPADSDGGAGMSSGGSPSAGSPSGGSPSAGSSTGGAPSAGASSGGTPSGGTGGSSAGAAAGGGGNGSGGAAGSAGSGGSSGGSGGGGAGGGQSMPTAVADIMGLNGMQVMGTATFTQGETMTKLVINLTACPAGKHSSHLHLNKDCGNNGMAAGNHWTPNGENFGDYTCADNKVTHMLERPTSQWTVGDGKDTDVTKHAFMVHAQGDDQGSGDRIGCGVVNQK